jgi:4a-hydroxytetrahydrobiopterin dehydratase
MSELAQKECVPCKEGAKPLKGEALQDLQHQVDPGWKVVEDETKIQRRFKLDNFKQALELTDDIGAIAEDQGHHPEIWLTWGKVEVTLWTHSAEGLTESDFILAAKIDEIELDALGD